MRHSKYDPEADAIYFELTEGVTFDSLEVTPNVVLDYNEDGQVVGIEFLKASKVLAPGPWKLDQATKYNPISEPRIVSGMFAGTSNVQINRHEAEKMVTLLSQALAVSPPDFRGIISSMANQNEMHAVSSDTIGSHERRKRA